MANASLLARSILTTSFFLYILPYGLTYLHLRGKLLRTSNGGALLQVVQPLHESPAGMTDLAGLYRLHGRQYIKLVPNTVRYPDILMTENAISGSALKTNPGNRTSFSKVRDIMSMCLDAAGRGAYCNDTQSSVYNVVPYNVNPGNSGRSSHSTWDQLTVDIPATSLVVALNVALAFCYWNRNVNPERVFKDYSRMMQEPFEIWRVFTGATAHFEIWHLGLNMMSMAALGTELEGLYPSFAFFFYNFSLTCFVSMIWLGLQKGTQYYTGASARQPTLGYSGVLFAWMVVASLEQKGTCPIIFLPSLCFQTHQLGPLKLSLAPLVQLIVMQVVLPRVSMTGHLAGIIAGFLLHWGLLPLQYFQPCIFVPLMNLIYVRFIRRIEIKSWSMRNIEFNLQLELLLHASVFLFSLWVFRVLHPLNLTYILVLVYWMYGKVFFQADNSECSGPRLAYQKGYVVTAVMLIVNDAVTFSGLCLLECFSFCSLCVFFLRATSLMLSIVNADILKASHGNCVFEMVFGLTVLEPCRVLAHQFQPGCLGQMVSQDADVEMNALSTSSFAGQGHRLGR